ncbi:MarR family winged helix-turn-helix transcriptional regulator [uncultured Methanospirillum sp.]|uniref:MarR family winged helix-turn-helix transcriptional regulator n=1 Tax=uncultured Methanospirillum sp. TaxID=262503 RepID=UPI0029C78069|nr:MarR family winged helix-turn-helix transcriptional regulator [uncultured Methanospirillum sp.]
MGDEPAGESDLISTQILEILIRVVQKAAFIDSQPVDLGDGSLLSAGEIHLIDMAGQYPHDTISGLASRLGVTKSAVSQMVQKLVVKGYIDRCREEGNRKNICLHLTPSGKKAFAWHTSLHSCVDDQICSYLSSLSYNDRQILLELLIRMSTTIDHSLKIRDDHIRNFLSTYSVESS